MSVRAVSGLTQEQILHDIPLALAFAYEHAYLASQGKICRPITDTL